MSFLWLKVQLTFFKGGLCRKLGVGEERVIMRYLGKVGVRPARDCGLDPQTPPKTVNASALILGLENYPDPRGAARMEKAFPVCLDTTSTAVEPE